ncbi:MAG: hypothetical protein LBF33_00080 [Oscillospiraceae bacterium]|nr:hypothetical protein [Oscillospiraceae bacterium]
MAWSGFRFVFLKASLCYHRRRVVHAGYGVKFLYGVCLFVGNTGCVIICKLVGYYVVYFTKV